MTPELSLSQDWAGWLVLVLSFLAIALIPEARRDARVAGALFVVLALHHLVALTNAYITTTPGADADANTFQRVASEIGGGAEDLALGIGARLYRLQLGSVYRVFGVSHLLGEELSVVAFLGTCVVLLRTLGRLGVSYGAPSVVLMLGALPTMVLFGSVTLREPWQVLFLVMSIHFALRYHRSRAARDFIVASVLALAMGFYHDALLVYSAFMLGVLAFSATSLRAANFFESARRAAVAAFVVTVTVGGLAVLASRVDRESASWLFTTMFEGDAVERLQQYREGGILSAEDAEARTTYGVEFDTSSWQRMAVSAAPAFAYYMLTPFPWQARSALDLYAATEVVWRLLLLGAAIVTWWRSEGPDRRFFLFLLAVYTSLSFFWSLGTVNYGTAIRHHMTTYPILVLMGGPRVVAAARAMFGALSRRTPRLTGVRADEA